VWKRRRAAPYGERQVQPGDYVNIGSNLNRQQPDQCRAAAEHLGDGQLQRNAAHAGTGPAGRHHRRQFPNEKLHGRVECISPASGSQFALLPPDNATGNFTKVVHRMPVRIQLDNRQPRLERLLPGMSVVTNIKTGEAVANGEK
jgi:membrane fusion protein, multidrug efflux system